MVMQPHAAESSHPPHVPDKSKSRPSRRAAAWWKASRNFPATETGISSLIAFFSTVLIAFILFGRYLTTDPLVKADVSLQEIRAERLLRVEDTEATERARYEARQTVVPIYKKDPAAERIVRERVVTALEKVETVRSTANQPITQKTSTLKKVLSQFDDAPAPVLEAMLTTMSWRTFYDTAVQTTNNLLEQGIKAEDYRTRRDALIMRNIPHRVLLTTPEIDALVFLIGSELRPTYFIDDKATEAARDIAASHVKPIWSVFNPGDIIVGKGSNITTLQRDTLKQQGDLLGKNRWLLAFGITFLSFGLMSVVWAYLYRFEHSHFFKPEYVGLLATTCVTAVVLLTLGVRLWPTLPMALYPVAILPILLCLFIHARVAMLATMMVLLLCGLALHIRLESLTVLVLSSMTGIFALTRKPVPSDRGDLIVAGLIVGLTAAATMGALHLLYDPAEADVQFGLLNQMILAVLSGILSGILASGVLPILESWFKLVTPFTLLELSNHNRPLLRRLQLEAPGTFHHSVMVATLAETAAEAIGANPILTRAGALYHDIGKLKRPLFFIENQAYFGVENPHDKLSPRLSKMVITAHPRDGVELARQLHLPKAIIRFMPEHHGTMMAGYFYHQAVLQEGADKVNKAQFRYQGPKPQTRESAIVMMADACESAVRALKTPTVAQIEERVDKIIRQRIEDDQFSECPITLQEIQIVRDTFVRILRGIQHNRIEYQENVLKELGKRTTSEDLRDVAGLLKSTENEIRELMRHEPEAPADESASAGGGGQPHLKTPMAKPIERCAHDSDFEDLWGRGPYCC